MLIMAEVTVEMAEELKASALTKDTSVAAEVGRRLERLATIDAKLLRGAGWVVPDESLYSGAPNPWDMFRNNTGNGR